jgi:hypothetical protein
MSTDHRRGAEKSPARKPYRKPKLEEYGTIRKITAHIGSASPNIDPPPHVSKSRTH